MPRVAHFLQNPGLLGSPPNEAFLAAYKALNYGVDLFSTWPAELPRTEPGVTPRRTEYTYRWLARCGTNPSWRRYAAFSATTEDPAAVAGTLATAWRRPLITLADEIRNGSYAGNRGRRWKSLCRWGMRRSVFTVVNENERVGIQREYAGLGADAEVLVYPGCFRSSPPPSDRSRLRSSRGIPEDAFVLCYSGILSYENGALWLVEALRRCKDLWIWGQIVNLSPLIRGLLQNVSGHERLVLEEQRLGWRECWSSMSAVDVGLVVYLQDAPQYRHMGTSSNRLCMFLAMGVPVVASRQPSFEFIERYGCGVLVDDLSGVPAAVAKVLGEKEAMSANALRCAREYIQADRRWEELRDRVALLLNRAGNS